MKHYSMSAMPASATATKLYNAALPLQDYGIFVIWNRIVPRPTALPFVCLSIRLSVCSVHRVAKSSSPLNVRSGNATESSKLCEQYSVTEFYTVLHINQQGLKNQACTVQYLSPKHGSALPNIRLGSKIPCLAYIQYTFIAKIPGLAV